MAQYSVITKKGIKSFCRSGVQFGQLPTILGELGKEYRPGDLVLTKAIADEPMLVVEKISAKKKAEIEADQEVVAIEPEVVEEVVEEAEEVPAKPKKTKK